MIVFSVLAMNLTGAAGVSMGILVYLFESGVFSMIFAISLRGMAEHTKTAAALLTGAISGGAVFPFIQNPVAEKRSISYSLCVPVALFSFGAIFPLYLNLVPAAKRQVDPIHDEYLQNDPFGRRVDLERSSEDPRGGTGIMHELAPWPVSSPSSSHDSTSGDTTSGDPPSGKPSPAVRHSR